MPDLSTGFDYPNPYGLRAADFNYAMEEYTAALKFLSDLAGGTPEPRALESNGGTVAMLRAWEGSSKFRRVLGKCRVAGESERAAQAAREAEADEKEPEDTPGQKFVPLEDVPPSRSVFSGQPNAASWGE